MEIGIDKTHLFEVQRNLLGRTLVLQRLDRLKHLVLPSLAVGFIEMAHKERESVEVLDDFVHGLCSKVAHPLWEFGAGDDGEGFEVGGVGEGVDDRVGIRDGSGVGVRHGEDVDGGAERYGEDEKCPAICQGAERCIWTWALPVLDTLTWRPLGDFETTSLSVFES